MRVARSAGQDFASFLVQRAAPTVTMTSGRGAILPLIPVQESPVVDPDFVFIVSYSCPRCHAALEARASGPPAWLRCPSCGRASLPPEQDRIAPPPYADERTTILGQFTTGGPIPPLPIRPRMAPPLLPRKTPATPTARIFLGVGFFSATALFVFSLLDSQGGRAGVFGFLAVICLILLARQAGRPPAD